MAQQEQDSNLKKQDYRKWVEAQYTEALEKELLRLESNRTNLRQKEEENDQPEANPSLWFYQRVKEQLNKVARHIEAVQQEMTARRVRELSKSETPPASAGAHKHKKTTPTVAARNAVIKANAALPALNVCEALDSEQAKLPKGTDWAPYLSHEEPWADAYRHGGEELRRRIRVIISKGKKA
jgi:hypothetical protein